MKKRRTSGDSERGKPADFDRRTGEVHGSGSGAGGGGNPDEDYDSDPAAGGGDDPVGAPRRLGIGHPLPGSREARHNEIPEHAEQEKGRGDDPRAVIQPAGEPVTPEGEPYRYDDLGRGPGSKESEMADDRRERLSEELPRNQKQSGIKGSGRQVGGGPGAADNSAPGGSSGSGGYGGSEDAQMLQGAKDRTLSGGLSEQRLSRGERFDEQQGGGRDSASVSRGEDELKRDQGEHQDRGQTIAATESDRD